MRPPARALAVLSLVLQGTSKFVLQVVPDAEDLGSFEHLRRYTPSAGLSFSRFHPITVATVEVAVEEEAHEA